jgi:hypothetical protein
MMQGRSKPLWVISRSTPADPESGEKRRRERESAQVEYRSTLSQKVEGREGEKGYHWSREFPHLE